MIAFDFCGYEGFKSRFGYISHNNGVKSRRNKILLSFIKNKELIKQARITGDYSLLHIDNITDLKKILLERIMESGKSSEKLKYQVHLINYTFYSSIYSTDENKGVCLDGDIKAIRYENHERDDFFKMKAGKFIRAVIQETEFGKTLPEQVMVFLQESFVEEWAAFSTALLPTHKLVISREFGKIYNSSKCGHGFHSCMIDQGFHSFYSDAVDASAAYLENDKGIIIARCIIFNTVYEEDSDKVWRLAERQYATDESNILKRALVESLVKGGFIDGFKQVGFDCHNSRGFVDIEGNSLADKKFYINCDLDTDDRLSYQDSFKWYDIDRRQAYNYERCDYDYCLDTTEGSIDGEEEYGDENYDSYHGEYTANDLVTVHVGDATYACDENWLEEFIYLTGMGYYHIDDVAICPECGKKFLKNDRWYSDILERNYCSEDCMKEAEEKVEEKELEPALELAV